MAQVQHQDLEQGQNKIIRSASLNTAVLQMSKQLVGKTLTAQSNERVLS